MTESTHLRLPFIAAAQAQKHVTHNEALRALDAIVMLAVDDRDLSAPPDTPLEGARYLVKPSGSGAFAGKDNRIAHFRDGAFAFHEPRAGWIAYVADEDILLMHDGSAWRPLLGTAPELQNVARLGIATAADATNPLAARLNNALWTARTLAEGGDGDLRYKLNKEAAGNTLSLLLQTAYSGRAEIGLAGDDDLHVKVSADGATWREAMLVSRASGKVSFPQGVTGLRERLTAVRTYYVRTDGNDANDGLTDSAGGAFLTIQKALDVVFGLLDLGSYDVTIQLADGTYTAGASIAGAKVGSGAITVQGNAAAPANVIVTAPAAACFKMAGGAAIAVKDMQLQSSGAAISLWATAGASISFSNLRFAGTGNVHIRAELGGSVEASGDYAIVGNASAHFSAGLVGVIRVSGRTITLSGSPAFSFSFAQGSTGGQMVLNGNTFSGGATGKRYDLILNSAINTVGGGATYLPGDAAGTTASGGQYA